MSARSVCIIILTSPVTAVPRFSPPPHLSCFPASTRLPPLSVLSRLIVTVGLWHQVSLVGEVIELHLRPCLLFLMSWIMTVLWTVLAKERSGVVLSSQLQMWGGCILSVHTEQLYSSTFAPSFTASCLIINQFMAALSAAQTCCPAFMQITAAYSYKPFICSPWCCGNLPLVSAPPCLTSAGAYWRNLWCFEMEPFSLSGWTEILIRITIYSFFPSAHPFLLFRKHPR